MSELAPNSNEMLDSARGEFGKRVLALRALAGLLLLLAVYAPGSGSLDSPWINGDEFVFIVNNPDVTGAGLETAGAAERLKRIFTYPPREDLYQPIPILTYAMEWALWGDSPRHVRRHDVFLHGLNAVLLWRVLVLLLARGQATGSRRRIEAAAWGLALIWGLHPVLVSAYASDMGRTHLLSATFALAALLLHLHALTTGRSAFFAAALLALILAMLCKVIVGWVALVFLVEVAVVGLRRALRSPRVYLVGLLCIVFAALALATSRRSGMMEDAAKGLFGEPISRSLLAVWIYARNVFAPLWLRAWYLPDPETHWGNPRVWIGVALIAATIVHAGVAWRRRESRPITIGWIWCWALLLPVIGLVGAREAAAADRYLYQPLMGMMLVLGCYVVRPLLATHPDAAARRTRNFVITCASFGALLLVADRPHARVARDPIGRAQRVVALNPGDPRAMEMLAIAYDFARNHPLPAADQPNPAQVGDVGPYRYFNEKCRSELLRASQVADLKHYFPGADDRAPFHRRIAYRLLLVGNPAESLEQAQIARELQPDAYLTWKRLAHGYQGLGRWAEARQAYERAESLLPEHAATRAVHYTDFGTLLVSRLNQPSEARAKFAAATEFLPAVESESVRIHAAIGLARCEIRAGQGSEGFRLIAAVLQKQPENLDAALVLGEYHLRSHEWVHAHRVYTRMIEIRPTMYAALRGFHEVCAQTGRWMDAASAWDRALRLRPDDRAFRSYWVWTLACAAEESAPSRIDKLLKEDPNNPYACYGRMLLALREADLEDALRWAETARRGRPIREARATARAAATLKLMRGQAELRAEVAILEAVLTADAGNRKRARQILKQFLGASAKTGAREVAERVLAGLAADANGN